MQWKVKPEPITPKAYDARMITKFAWLPIRATGNIMIWLERYQERQGYGPFSHNWVELARYAIEAKGPYHGSD